MVDPNLSFSAGKSAKAGPGCGPRVVDETDGLGLPPKRSPSRTRTTNTFETSGPNAPKAKPK